MKKMIFLICIAIASLALAACSKDDNPIDSGANVNIDNPQEQVTDQPANAPVK